MVQSPALIVLITNNTLAEPAGTDRYVMTVARYLLENGHYPVVYSTKHGAVAEEIRSLGVPVLDSLDNLSVEPDIIHGHHHLDTACAIFRFPETPIIAFSHGVVLWEEAIFPPINRIYAYVTVSQARLKRVHTEGVPSDKTVHLPNFVDTDEFTVNFANRKQHHSGITRALVNGNASHKGLVAIKIACRRFGFKLDQSGHAFGQTACQPSRLLPGYELVFASGKAAMEALYCGAEVILSGPMASALTSPHQISAISTTGTSAWPSPAFLPLNPEWTAPCGVPIAGSKPAVVACLQRNFMAFPINLSCQDCSLSTEMRSATGSSIAPADKRRPKRNTQPFRAICTF
jgi:hypothetical protein